MNTQSAIRNTAQNIATRELPLTAALEELEGAVSRVQEKLISLGQRLRPVVTPAPADSHADVNRKSEIVIDRVSDRLRSQISHLLETEETLCFLLNNLEL